MMRSKTSPISSVLEPSLPYPPLFTVSSHWCAPWLVTAGTRVGTRHNTAGLPSDDAVLITQCGSSILLAIADGAGDYRAVHSGEASRRAVATASAEVQRSLSVHGTGDPQGLIEGLASAHLDLVARAQAKGIDPMAYATTLTLVLLSGNRVTAARIGDGSLYTWDGKDMMRFCVAPLPQTATPMLTQADWRKWMATGAIERDYIIGIALCTDGADEFFLEDKRHQRVPSPTILKNLSAFCDQFGPTGAFGFASQMLNDPNWAKQSADDRSFILAFKPQTDTARPRARTPQ